ncbi:pirin family protein [Paludibacter sp.]
MSASKRSVESVISPRPPHYVGDGFRVHNFIPAIRELSMQRMDPFLVMDYNSKYYFSPSETPRGVGVHPHRGFETVTIAYKGRVEHHDSHGGGGIIGEGDVQWMTAAGGILHKEFHEKTWSREGGDFQMVQLWVNLPKKHKMSKPKYQAVTNDLMAKYKLDDDKGIVEIIAGEYKGFKGPAFTFSPVNLFNAKLKKDAVATFDFPKNYNTALLIIEGAITVNDSHSALVDHFVLMANDGNEFSIKASEDSIVLILSGEPLNESIAAHGPFVMNTRDEIIEAFDDYNSGKFGYLED